MSGHVHWRGRLVRLRAIEPEDWERFFADHDDVEGQRSGWQVHEPRSAEATKVWAREQSAVDAATADRFSLAIEEIKTGALAGRSRRTASTAATATLSTA